MDYKADTFYRLLRAGLTQAELEQLRAHDHGVVLLMLATLIGFPEQAAYILEQLITASDTLPRTFSDLISDQLTDRAGAADRVLWRRLELAVKGALASHPVPIEVAIYQRWAPNVARFSFRTGHLAR